MYRSQIFLDVSFYTTTTLATATAASALRALIENYTTNANLDWTVNGINTAGVDSFSVQEVV